MVDTLILHDYSNEARELIEEMDGTLIRLEEEGASRDLLTDLFQAIHWLRVCSERFALTRSGILTDGLEILLDRLRNDMVEWEPDMIDLLHRAKELLFTLIEEVARENEENTDVSAIVEELEDLLNRTSVWSSESPEEPISEEVRIFTEIEPMDNAVEPCTIRTLEAGSTLGETVPYVLTMILHLNDLENGIGFGEVRSSILQTVRTLRESLSFIGIPAGVSLLTEMERRIARHPETARGMPSDELRGLRLLAHDLCGYYPADTFPCEKRMTAKPVNSLTDGASVQVDDWLLGEFERHFQGIHGTDMPHVFKQLARMSSEWAGTLSEQLDLIRETTDPGTAEILLSFGWEIHHEILTLFDRVERGIAQSSDVEACAEAIDFMRSCASHADYGRLVSFLGEWCDTTLWIAESPDSLSSDDFSFMVRGMSEFHRFLMGLERILDCSGAVESVAACDTGTSADMENPSDALYFRTMRVEAGRVDSLLNEVRELSVTRAQIDQLALELKHLEEALNLSTETGTGDGEAAQGLSCRIEEAGRSLGEVTGNLCESVRKLRMLPVGRLFTRMPPLIRRASRNTGKTVMLRVHGAETQLDKGILEQLSNPLTDLIRNAIEHGIEDHRTRRESGKDEEGSITLRASSRDDTVVIDVEDDGSGIDAQMVLEKAAESGLIDSSEGKDLATEEWLDLLFEPSLFKSIGGSDASGRETGLRAVKQDIDKLNGHLEVESWDGKGTRITITVPRTLTSTETF